MSKQNQYYSEWNDTPEHEYYRDHNNHETDGDRHNEYSSHEYGQEWTESPADAYLDIENHPAHDDTGWHQETTDDTYFEPLSAVQSHEWTDTTQQNDEHFSQESERGFNLLFDTVLPSSAGSSDHYDDYYDDHDIVGALTNQQKASGIQVYADDLVDCPRKVNNLQIPRPVVLVGLLGLLAAIGTAIFQFSQPDLSAYEIVQMESYDGIQKAPEIFNLTNLDECSSQSDCIKNSLNASKADIAEYTEKNSAIREIPAAVSPTYRPTVSDSVDTTDNAILASTISAEVPALLNQTLKVQAQWSNVRDAPGMSGAIVGSLAKGTRVSVVNSSGSWFEIQADNTRQTRGYMHQSTLTTL